MKKVTSILLVTVLIIILSFTGCEKKEELNSSSEITQNVNISETDYSVTENWAYLEKEEEKSTDVFFICPTVYMGEKDTYNMSLSDKDTKANFLGATNMEKAIYDGNSRFFAPYYRQAGLNAYDKDLGDKSEDYFEIAYSDVKASFDYYMKKYNNGHPFVLAGFSQGADMCIRLIKDEFDDKKISDLLIACYAIGWRVTEEETNEFKQLKMAQNESDTGVIIAFNSEAENITDSMMVPSGTKTFSINPLNWKTDSTKADKALNKGACFTDYNGNIKTEINALTGAYIDETRGTLKVTDVSASDYPPVLDIFSDGIYHLYDYQFFFRNIQENVKTRIDAYQSK